MTRYTLRQYNVPYALLAFSYAGSVPLKPDVFLAQVLSPDAFGYDFWGNEIDDELPYTDSTGVVSAAFGAPPHPIIAAAYVQDKIEFDDLTMNVGLRYDYIDSRGKEFKDPFRVICTAVGLLERNQIIDVPPYGTVSPRIGLSFAASENTMLHAHYGKYVQQSRFKDIFRGLIPFWGELFSTPQFINPIGWGLHPERSTQYELGITQIVGTNASFDITLYYKDVIDQAQVREILSMPCSLYVLINGDYGTTEGLEFKFNLRRTQRVAVDLLYALSDAKGTGSFSASQLSILYGYGSQAYLPLYIEPLVFDQRHHGAISFDYRFAEDDGPTVLGAKMFEGSGLNLLFTFNSGHPYTRVNRWTVPVEEFNASETPWNYRLDMKLDKMLKIGPLDVDIYVYVINLLNSENPQEVFSTTGDSQEDGYLSSDFGRAQLKLLGESYAQMYRQLNLESVNLGLPRQIRFGLRINYEWESRIFILSYARSEPVRAMGRLFFLAAFLIATLLRFHYIETRESGEFETFGHTFRLYQVVRVSNPPSSLIVDPLTIGVSYEISIRLYHYPHDDEHRILTTDRRAKLETSDHGQMH